MTTLATARDKLANLVQTQHTKYESDADRPLGGYAMTMTVYASVAGAVANPVTSPLRAPFTAYQDTSGPAELQEEVRGSGAQKTVGEHITCPFCTGI